MYRAASIALLASGIVVGAGCLAEPPVVVPDHNQCSTTADCDVANGEVCDQGVCWGNPPSSVDFAAVLVPPTGRDDIVPTELLSLDVAEDGTVSNLVFGDYITVSGRVVLECGDNTVPDLCDPSISTSAKLFIRRQSRIPGGPRYTRTVDVTPQQPEGTPAFSFRLPRLDAGDDPYEITVEPSDDTSDANGVTPAMLAPPLRVTVAGTKDELGVDWRLGHPDNHIQVSGRVLDAVGTGIAGLQVSAQGRWTPLGELVDASSLATTDSDGVFTFYVPKDMVPFFDIIVKPEPGTIKPTLRAYNVPIIEPDVPGTTVFVADLHMPSHPQPVMYRLPVVGQDGSGNEVPVAGANVRVETPLDSDPNTTATYVAQGATDVDGIAKLMLIPGSQSNRTYKTRVLSPPSSTQASKFDFDLQVGPFDGSTNVLPEIVLEHRVAISGVVVNNDGVAIEGASVSAQVGNAFKLALTLTEQTSLEALQLPSVTTDANGEFLLWLDPTLGPYTAGYDLEIVPPATADAPHWSVNAVSFDVNTAGSYRNKDLTTIKLPAAAWIRGSIVTSNGETMPDAEVRLFQISDEYSICETAMPRGTTACVPPARPRGVWHANEQGSVWMILPR